MPTAIVTDSTADIDPAEAERLGIEVVPLFVNFGDRRYRDRIDLSRAEFYRKLATERALPTTAQPTPAMFEEAFRPHVEAGNEIVVLTIAQTYSGTINAARAAALVFPGATIALVDSHAVAGGLALQVLHAAELAATGANAAAVVAELDGDRARQMGYATIPDLSHAVRTGRVSRSRALIGSLVKVLPVLRLVDGRVEEEARVRTFARAQDAMIEAALSNVGNVETARLMVMHTNVPELAMSIYDRIVERLPGTPAYLGVLEAGPVIAAHTGAGAVGAFTIAGPQ
jgi:DegV family protein with EDD domain